MAVYEKEIEVRYAETDQMGVVYHANYLVWFELGRSALLAAQGGWTMRAWNSKVSFRP